MKRFFFFNLFIFSFLFGFAQPKMLDGVIAVVGANPILKSELDAKQVMAKRDSIEFSTCEGLEDLLYRKLLFAQAIKDSVEVTDEQVEDELDRRLRQYIPQFGSIKAFEEFLGKSVEKFKEESREELREELLVQRMQAKITEGVTVSPAEIKSFFESIHKDSVPLINAEIEVGHIVKTPTINPELKKYAKEKISALRDDIIVGRKDFATSAIINSMDPASAPQGGLYKNVTRGMFNNPEFDAAAFRTKEKEVSAVFETSFGYHILTVDAIRGEEVDLRHILIMPQPSPEDMMNAKTFLDSVAHLVRKDSITITEAASRFSDDEETKHNGGLISNPYTGSTKLEMSQLGQIDQFLVFTTDKLKTGELSEPSLTQIRAGQAYHMVYVKSRTEPHRANLKEDYQRIQDEALAEKKEKVVNAWIKKKIVTTYLRISDEYKNCKFDNPWVN